MLTDTASTIFTNHDHEPRPQLYDLRSRFTHPFRRPSSSLSYMSDLSERLVGLGLSQYCEILTNEGFDTWETLLDITESDL